MPVESFGFIEHFDYMKNYVPQPFYIHSKDVLSFEKHAVEDEYLIKTARGNYLLSKSSLKKMVDALGIKIRLLNAVCEETDVLDLVLPILNKLFKCFADCFVFYAKADDSFTIIDLNVNSEKGDEGTKYENGPSPWKLDIVHNAAFTCFADFKDKYCIDDSCTDLLVKADDLMSGTSVMMNLFKTVTGAISQIQPMLTFSSKFSNMNGFTEIHPMLYDPDTKVCISFPMNYAKIEGASFDDLWKKAMHVYETADLNDYIFKEVNELAASSETPSFVQNFITDVLINSTINLNQPIKNILTESTTVTADMKPAKKKKFLKQLGALIAFALCMKHTGCEHCGHLPL